MSAARHHCVLCVPGQGHHPTRRPSATAPYFDPALRLWLCSEPPHNHHARVHEALRSLALDLLPEGMDPLTYRVLVLAVHAGVFADDGAAFAVADAAASRALQSLWLEVADALAASEERVS
ncbi:MAG: hypothetical protein ACLPQS_04170 [Acidimicrobiales bacterium]